MRTLEDFRAWVRAGCQVSDEPETILLEAPEGWVECGTFRLSVIRGADAYDITMRAQCLCGKEERWSMVKQMPHPDTPEPDLITPIQFLAGWMAGHSIAGGMDSREASNVFAESFRGSYQVLDWAELRVRGKDGSEYAGRVNVPMGDIRGTLPIYLEAEAP